MAFLVATTSLPAVYRPNGYARTTTAGTPHARANWDFLRNLEAEAKFTLSYKKKCVYISKNLPV